MYDAQHRLPARRMCMIAQRKQRACRKDMDIGGVEKWKLYFFY